MRINMWMIANRLEGLDYQTHLRADSPLVLHSARLVYAPNCVQLKQDDSDVLCIFGEESIRIRDIELKYAFELIQGVFDFYDDWYTRSVTYARENNWCALIDELSYILRNPIVFFDSNNRVIAMSRAYDGDEVDEEWSYLQRYGVSNTKMMLIGRQNVEKEGEDWTIQFVKNPQQMKCGIVTTRIVTSGKTYGYISALELKRRLNDGDSKLLLLFTELITPSFAFYCNTQLEYTTSNCFRELLLEGHADSSTLTLQTGYFNIKKNDRLRVIVLRAAGEADAADLLLLKRNILCNCPHMPVLSIEDHLAVIADIDNNCDTSLERFLRELGQFEQFQIGVSVECTDIQYLWAHYQQALFALSYADASREARLHLFSHHAVDYMLQNADRRRLICACHPGIRAMFEKSNGQNDEFLTSLEVYLLHERSLSQAARKLFVHKNTLLYRIQKIEDACGCDLSDPMEREYILLSIRVLRLFDH